MGDFFWGLITGIGTTFVFVALVSAGNPWKLFALGAALVVLGGAMFMDRRNV